MAKVPSSLALLKADTIAITHNLLVGSSVCHTTNTSNVNNIVETSYTTVTKQLFQ